jgi:hypothetical protein
MTTLECKNAPNPDSLRWRRSGSVRGLLLLGLAGGLILGGCKKQPQNAAPAPAEPAASAPAPEAATPATAPGSPAAPAPQTQAAAPPPPAPPPPPKVYTVPAGTRLTVRVSQTISSKTSNVGDPFQGTLAQSVRVDGVPVLRAGAPVSGTVVGVKGQGRFKGAGDLAIALNRVGSASVSTSAYEKTASGKGKRSAAMIGGGGGGGALIGGLAGGGKGALIGGLLGAGGGTAVAGLTGNKEISIPAESLVSFTTTAPVTVERRQSAEDSQ